jgi:hypothetical protein
LSIGAKLKGPKVVDEDDELAAKFRVGLMMGVSPKFPKVLLLEEEEMLDAGEPIAE